MSNLFMVLVQVLCHQYVYEIMERYAANELVCLVVRL
jgi:hypothetical protein